MREAASSNVVAVEPVWVDVQGHLDAAAHRLGIDELLHGPEFSLFEAMSAIEVGDPRLDAGLMAKEQMTSSSPSEEAAPAQPSTEDVLRVMEHLLRLEATWHIGNSLAQTVFTCLYLLHPCRLRKHALLSAYCESVRATCCAVRNLVIQGAACEDEDFLPHAFGLDLEGQNNPGAMAPGAADEALAEAERRLNVPAAPSNAVASGYAPQLEDQPAEREALLCFVRLRQAINWGMAVLTRNTADGMKAAAQHFGAAMRCLEELARQPGIAGDGAAPGFNPNVNDYLLASVPPRATQVVSRVDALEYFRALLGQLLAVCEVTAVRTWDDAHAFLMDIGGRGWGPLARSALHMVLSGCGAAGGASLPPWAVAAPMLRSELGLPPPEALPPEAAAFMAKALPGVQGWCQAMCMNAARQRRRHRRAVEDWAALHAAACAADDAPSLALRWPRAAVWDPGALGGQGLLATWVERQCAGVLLQHLLAGAALELYAPQELSMVYWYCDYLWGVVHLDCQALLKHPAGAALPNGVEATGRASPSGQQPPAGQHANAPVPLQLQLQEAVLERQMCSAAMRMAAGLEAGRRIPHHPTPFNSQSEQFEQRFAALHHLRRPEPLSYADFCSAVLQSGLPARQMLRYARDGYSAARRLVHVVRDCAQRAGISDQARAFALDRLRATERVAMHNVVAIDVMLREPGLGGPAPGLPATCQNVKPLQASFSMVHHPHHPALVVSRGHCSQGVSC